MILDGIPFESMSQSHLQALVEGKVIERRTIEYKQTLPGNSDADRKEFLADVSSFANSAGGYLIYGMKAKSAVPTDLCGLGEINADIERGRLQEMILTGLKPRIFGVLVGLVDLGEKNWAMIIKVPSSWASPHRVTFKGHNRFYYRHSGGKQEMDVDELRTAFVLSETRAERIRNFRAERLARMKSDETPVPLEPGSKTVVHLVPFTAFEPSAIIDINSVANDQDLAPIGEQRIDWRYSFDGILSFTVPDTMTAQMRASPILRRGYVLLFRNGIVEAVTTAFLDHKNNQGNSYVGSKAYESAIWQAVKRYLGIQKKLNVRTPVYCIVSLLGIKGAIVDLYKSAASHREQAASGQACPVDRDDLNLPEVLFESFDRDPAAAMKTAFDTIWNACGLPRSLNYDESGEWHV